MVKKKILVPLKLKRELGLFQVTVAAIGIILGAGIYALIGVAAEKAGNAIWLSFFLASLVAAFTGLSYAELSSMFRKDAGEFDYVKNAFNFRIAWIVGVMILLTGVISAATVALGFAGYFVSMLNVNFYTATMVIIVLMSLINFYGIKESAWFNTFATFIEFLGLLIIILLGLRNFGSVNLLEMPYGFTGVLQSAALVFFAYMGFETIVKLAEETKKPAKTLPLAIVLAVIITTLLYILVSISAVSVLDWRILSVSEAPLAEVASLYLGRISFMILAIIALFSTANTILVTLVTSARMLYAMAKEKAFPMILASIHERTRTPYIAVFLLMLITIAFSLLGDIEFVANLNNLFLFLTFAFVNLSAIVLRYKKVPKRKFKVPLNIGKFPVLSFLGLLSSLFMLVFVVINLM